MLFVLFLQLNWRARDHNKGRIHHNCCTDYNEQRLFHFIHHPHDFGWFYTNTSLWHIFSLRASYQPSPLLPPPCGSDPGTDAACPIQQLPSVLGTYYWLHEQQDPKLSHQPTEDCSCHNHKWRHYHKAKNDEGGAAVVVKVTADGGRGIKDLQGQTHKGV